MVKAPKALSPTPTSTDALVAIVLFSAPGTVRAQARTLPLAPEPLETLCKCRSEAASVYAVFLLRTLTVSNGEPLSASHTPGLVCGFSSVENVGKIGNTRSSSSSCLDLWPLEELLLSAFLTFLAIITRWNLAYGALCDSHPSLRIKRTACSEQSYFPRTVAKEEMQKRALVGPEFPWVIAWT